MKTTRERIYQAAFDFARTIPGIRTASRRVVALSEVAPEQQPALYMEQIGENPQRQGKGIPYKWHLDVMFLLYVWSADDTIPPATLMNPILDGFEEMFRPGDHQPVQTLGGLVVEARLLGEDKLYPMTGSFANQAVAYLPLRIVAV